MKSAIAQEGSDEQVPKSRLFMPSADPFSARLTHAFCHVFCLLGVIGLLVWNAYLAYELATDLRMNDFGRFYYTAVAFLQGQEMYGPRPAEVVQPSELRTGQQLGNLNPPHFHLDVFAST